MCAQRERIVVVVALVLFLAAGAAAQAKDARKAKEFAYQDVNPKSATHGKTISLTEVYGKEGVVLNFIASWCPPCWQELPSFQKLDRESSTPVVLIAADEHGPADDLLARAGQLGLDLPILLVPTADIEKMERFWDHSMLPSTYMIDFQGNIREVFEGMVEEETLFRTAARHFPRSGISAPAETTGAVRQ